MNLRQWMYSKSKTNSYLVKGARITSNTVSLMFQGKVLPTEKQAVRIYNFCEEKVPLEEILDGTAFLEIREYNKLKKDLRNGRE